MAFNYLFFVISVKLGNFMILTTRNSKLAAAAGKKRAQATHGVANQDDRATRQDHLCMRK